MKTKINSPDTFEKMMKVSGTRMWLVLSVLTVLIVTGLILFLTNPITISSEVEQCYVLGETMTYREALMEAVQEALPEYAYLYEGIEQSDVSYPLDGTVQPVILSFDENEESIRDGMPLRVQGRGGYVLISSLPMSLQQIIDKGYSEMELLKAGFVHSRRYTFTYAVLCLPEGTEPLPEGLYKAKILLDELEPVTLILK